MTNESEQKPSQQSAKYNSAIAVYSTYCGTFGNKTFNTKQVSIKYPHYFVSNNIEILNIVAASGWIPIHLNSEVSDNAIVSAHQAKFAKAAPNFIPQLSKYQYILYVDDKIDFDAERLPEFIELLDKSDSALSIRAHPFLSGNILLEYGKAMQQSRYREQTGKIVSYITNKLKSGYQLESQMYWTSAILRNNHHRDTLQINQTWWKDIQHCGIECQISFDFIAQQFKSISLLPQSIT